ncbi:MAG: glycosyltransferase [Cytophagales bacterium]|nr:glycosyltransferase [Cytophagales bacterium]
MKSQQPLVTIMCLCYNHAPFLKEALDSVYHQTHKNIQVILIDNKSEDNSVEILKTYHAKFPAQTHLVLNSENKGICRAINEVLPLVKGKYIVDFATDDVFALNRLEKQVEAFEQLPKEYGIIFTDAQCIDEKGEKLNLHSDNPNIRVSEGNVYKDIVSRYFLCPPTLLVKKEVYDVLGGYDSCLAYEDFDFLVRASRQYKFHYLPQVLTFRRVVHNSMYTLFEAKDNYKMLESTYQICEKIYEMNQNQEEHKALAQRIYHELITAFRSRHFDLVRKYELLLKKIEKPTLFYQLIFSVNYLALGFFLKSSSSKIDK